MTDTRIRPSATSALLLAALLAVLLTGLGPAGAGGLADDIQVHGHWTIQVFDLDGTLAGHHEFENALTTGGGEALVRLLGREIDADGWAVTAQAPLIFGERGPSPCDGGSECYLIEPGGDFGPPTAFDTLGVVTDTAAVPDELRLTGSFTAVQDGAIGEVRTFLETCPGACDGTNGTFGVFTQRVLLDPDSGAIQEIAVAEGQVVTIVVELTFG